MSDAKLGFGTILKWGDAEIAELRSIDGPSLATDDVDVTSHDSTDAVKEFLAGLTDGGEVSFEGNFLSGDTSQTDLIDDQIARTTQTVTLTPASSTKSWTFTGYIKNLSFSSPYDTQQTINGTIKVAGKPTFAA
jgi:predicted secreted protein